MDILDVLDVLPSWNPYSRAQWTELQLRNATPEEIDTVVTALELLRRELGVRARGAKRTATGRMSPAAQDAALAAMWAATDRRRIGWILAYLREGIVHADYRDHAALLLEGPAILRPLSSCSGGCDRNAASGMGAASGRR